MDILGILNGRVDLFLLILARVSGMFQMAPVFASQRVPVVVRAALAAVISLILVISQPASPIPVTKLWYLVLGMAGEFLLGFAMGYVVNLVMAATQTAGQMIDMQMGFGIVNVLDPQSGQQIPLMGNFQYLLALMVLLGMNGHHLIINAIAGSYELVPLFGFKVDAATAGFMVSIFCGMFVSALKIALPLVAALFVTDVALGIVARTVPQMNVFIVGLPLKIVAGILLMIAVLGLYMWMVGKLLTDAFYDLDLFLRLLGA